ncbi:MAG: GNAT family N-acetyltransferase [Chloroflexi bacterium]|nr:GNAT family N-acetyltransferase [Chloroflexota bacterium]
MHYHLRAFHPEDYPAAYAPWRRTPGLSLSARADSRAAIEVFLRHNPGLSFVLVTEQDELVGTILGGFDGRRGYIHHLAVAVEHQGRGLGRVLVQRCLEAFAQLGLEKVHALVYTANRRGQGFWEHLGWRRRGDLVIYTWAFEPA